MSSPPSFFGKHPEQPGDLKIGLEPLSYVNEAKVLGLYLENILKWNTQVNTMLKKANKRLFMLRTLKRFGFSSDELRVVYGGYVRPILEYADVVWHSSITFKQSETLNPSKEEHVILYLGIHMSLMLMPWVVASLTLCLKRGRTTVVGLLKSFPIMSGLNLFSLLSWSLSTQLW